MSRLLALATLFTRLTMDWLSMATSSSSRTPSRKGETAAASSFFLSVSSMALVSSFVKHKNVDSAELRDWSLTLQVVVSQGGGGAWLCMGGAHSARGRRRSIKAAFILTI